MVVVNAGRFGLLLSEIAERCDAKVTLVEGEWGTVVDPQAVEDAVKRVRPRLVACVHGDTSTTMAQPIEAIGEICRRYDALLYVDATATIGGMSGAGRRLAGRHRHRRPAEVPGRTVRLGPDHDQRPRRRTHLRPHGMSRPASPRRRGHQWQWPPHRAPTISTWR